LELLPSAVENESGSTASETIPVRSWLNGQAFVIDVGGRIFFDRWVGGSSAEWTLLQSLINKAHSRDPLGGIILTIPADA